MTAIATTSPPRSDEKPRDAARTLRVIGPIGVVAGFYAAMAWSRRWLYEDGIINLRIVENLVNGHGPVFNIGQRVEVYTSPAQIFGLTFLRGLTFGLVSVEDLVFVLGVASATAGIVLAMLGAVHLWSSDDGWSLPVGALVFVAIPPAWDFATSGHEGGLSYLWIGAAFWILARRTREIRGGFRPPIDSSWPLLAWLGSGALVRPEYALYSLCIGVAWFVLHRSHDGSRLRAVAMALGPTIAYQLFRMGYFGLLLPNTAVAKLGAGIPPSWNYLWTFLSPFLLWLPLLVIGLLLVVLAGSGDRTQRATVLAFVVPGLLQIAYLWWIGGDYINARLLLPPLLALLAPVAVVPARFFRLPKGTEAGMARTVGGVVRLAGLAAIVSWAVLCATLLRAPWDADNDRFFEPRWDPRELTVQKILRGGSSRRVTEYESSLFATPFDDLVIARAQGHPDILSARSFFYSQYMTLPEGSDPAVVASGIGALGLLVYPYHVYDVLGLADPIAAHVPPEGRTPGHVRRLPLEWFYAQAGLTDSEPAKAAARALECGALGDLYAASTEPLTPGRFLTNIARSPTNTFLVVPKDPDDAIAKFC